MCSEQNVVFVHFYVDFPPSHLSLLLHESSLLDFRKSQSGLLSLIPEWEREMIIQLIIIIIIIIIIIKGLLNTVYSIDYISLEVLSSA